MFHTKKYTFYNFIFLTDISKCSARRGKTIFFFIWASVTKRFARSGMGWVKGKKNKGGRTYTWAKGLNNIYQSCRTIMWSKLERGPRSRQWEHRFQTSKCLCRLHAASINHSTREAVTEEESLKSLALLLFTLKFSGNQYLKICYPKYF